MLGRGSVTRIAKATGISRRAIHVGLEELSGKDFKAAAQLKAGKIRASGGGGAKKLQYKTQQSKKIWRACWNQQHAVIQSPHCAGHARV